MLPGVHIILTQRHAFFFFKQVQKERIQMYIVTCSVILACCPSPYFELVDWGTLPSFPVFIKCLIISPMKFTVIEIYFNLVLRCSFPYTFYRQVYTLAATSFSLSF